MISFKDYCKRVDETFRYDVDHMPGRRLSLADTKKTSKYTLAVVTTYV